MASGLLGRERGKSAYEAKQMTTVQAVGAVSSDTAEWYAIDRRAIHSNVRRLQVCIVKAVKAANLSFREDGRIGCSTIFYFKEKFGWEGWTRTTIARSRVRNLSLRGPQTSP